MKDHVVVVLTGRDETFRTRIESLVHDVGLQADHIGEGSSWSSFFFFFFCCSYVFSSSTSTSSSSSSSFMLLTRSQARCQQRDP